MPCHILFATPRLFFETLLMVLGMLLHVLKMIAIESQKSILYTSDVADTKVITTGEPTKHSLLVTALPSINDLFAGISHARNLLQAQPAKLQCILCESVDLDGLPF